VRKFIVTIEGRSWEDVAEIELPQLPGEGERIETKYGTCVVSQLEAGPRPEGGYRLRAKLPLAPA
jgi:hypothetical protein